MPKNWILRLFFYIIPILVFSGKLWGHTPHIAKPIANHHYFVENKGQWADNILFRAEIQQGNVLVTKEGITYQLFTKEPSKANIRIDHSNEGSSHHSKNHLIKGHIIKVVFENSSNDIYFLKFKQVEAKYQYLKGKDPIKWVQGAAAWTQLELKNVYPGINLKLYFANGLLKYDFMVSAGVSPNKIVLKYEGADSLKIEDNSLAIYTSLGKVYEKPPFSYQLTNIGKKEVACKFVLKNNTLQFSISKKYDSNLPLIIDPELVFSTYSGARADNWGNTATYDSLGNLYSGGVVFADSAFPVTPGAFQTFSRGNTDLLILKYSSDGSSLLFAAYLGGSGTEIPISMIVNGKNELIVLGITGSADFPISVGAFDNSFNGGVWTDAFINSTGTPFENQSLELELANGTDIFITVINTFTNTFIASTFLGGTSNDGIILGKTPPVKNYGDQLRGEVIVDKQDNIYLATHTYSQNLDGINSSLASNRGELDAIMVKLSPNLSGVDWVYWHGGEGHDSGFGVKVDNNLNAFMTGSTTSNNLFTSVINGIHTTYQGGIDGYIAKVDGLTGTLIDGTFIGTSLFDQSYFVDIDYNNDVYILGLTSGNYPVSQNVYFNKDGGQFIHKLNNDLTKTLFSTTIGSGKRRQSTGEIVPNISPTAFLVNDCRKIFLSGWGGRENQATEIWNYYDSFGNEQKFEFTTGYLDGNLIGMPTKDAFQNTTNGTGFYFMILQPEASSLAYATYFSGTFRNREHVDGGTSRFDKKGIIYQSVCASCGGFPTNFPTTPGVWSTTNNSINCNNAAIKFDLGKVVANLESLDSISSLPSQYGCVPITFRMKNLSSGATNYKWKADGGFISYKDDSVFIKFNKTGLKNIKLIAYDTSICRLIDSAQTTVNAVDVKADFPHDILQCGITPQNLIVKLYGNAKVTWSPSEGLSDPTIPNPIVSYTGKDIVYYITVTNDTLCQKFDTLSVKIRDPNPKTKLQVWDRDKTREQYSFCYPNEGLLTARSTPHDYVEWKEDGNTFDVGLDSNFHIFPYLGKIKYEVFIYDSICNRSASDTKIVTISQPKPTYPTDAILCPNTSISSQVIGENGFTYLWKPEILFSNPTSDVQTFLPKKNERISIIVTDTIGCVDSSGYNVSILEYVEAIMDKEYKYCRRKADGIEIYSNTLNNYLWEPSGYMGNPLKVTASGTYFFSGLDANNCPVKDTVKVVERCDPELYVPNAFSPNGDGQNDFFEVFGYDVSQFDIKIFDRWGEIIYNSTDFKFNWDGKYKGQTIPIGTYPFVISYKGTTFEGEPVSKTFSGDVTVVR